MELEINNENDLSVYEFCMKHQLKFTEYFGPGHAYGLKTLWSDGVTITAIARVKPSYKSVNGTTSQFTVSMKKFDIWRLNVNLYKFISSK